MKRFNIRFVVLFLLISIMNVTMNSNINAEFLYQLPKPDKPIPVPLKPKPLALYKNVGVRPNLQQKPLEGGAVLLNAISRLFMAFAALEYRDKQGANALLDEVRIGLKYGIEFYEQRIRLITDHPISVDNLTSYAIKVIKKDLQPYGGEIPKDMIELCSIAFREIKDFNEFMNSVNFKDDYDKNRKTGRDIVDRLLRYMRVGISISELEASNR